MKPESREFDFSLSSIRLMCNFLEKNTTTFGPLHEMFRAAIQRQSLGLKTLQI